ncbi:protein of unknown function [Serratia sp. Tan611]|nr:protein of unknown function [Serratia sp. Tan611]
MQVVCMAGVPGFEPGNAGIKNRCLTAWRYPNNRYKSFLLTAFPERRWLGYLDSNQGMPVSKTGALPLGDTPSAEPTTMKRVVREARLELAHLAAPEPKSGASTNFATPAKKMVATTGFEPVTPSL